MSRNTLVKWFRGFLVSRRPRLEHGLVALVVVSPLSIALTNFAYVSSIVLFARDWLAGRRAVSRTPLDGAILLWVLANVLSLVSSVDVLESAYDLRSLGHFGMVYLFAWAAGSSISLRTLQNLWLAAAVVMALKGLGPWTAALVSTGEPVRAQGFFGGHLAYGHYLLFPFSVGLARATDAATRREGALAGAAVCLFGAAIVASEGRAVFAAMVVILVVWGAVARGRALLALLVMLVALQFAHYSASNEGLLSYYRSFLAVGQSAAGDVEDDRLSSNLWRLTMWRGGLLRFAENPATGTGIETTGVVSAEFRETRPGFPVRHLHSNYIEVLMTRGFAGLFALILLFLAALRALVFGLRQVPPGAARAAIFGGIAGVLAHVVHGFTYYSIGKAEPQMGFLIVLGMALGALKSSSCERSFFRFDSTKILRAVVVLDVFLVAWPIFDESPSLAGIVVAAGFLDFAVSALRGHASLVSWALLASFAMVATLAILLLPAPDASSVMVAAGAAYGVFSLGRRIPLVVSAGPRRRLPDGARRAVEASGSAENLRRPSSSPERAGSRLR